MQGYHVLRTREARIGMPSGDFAHRSVTDFSQAMIVALGFYLFGHLADLASTIGFLSLGFPECNLIPALILKHGGLAALVFVKIAGALGTAWVFWRLRARFFTVIFTSAIAVLLIWVASINSLDLVQFFIL